MVPGTGIEPVPLAGANFKSATSTNFVIRASSLVYRAAICSAPHFLAAEEMNMPRPLALLVLTRLFMWTAAARRVWIT